MEIEGLKRVPLEEMPQELQDDAQMFWEIFDRGVKKAKAENERLGIVVNEDIDYIGAAKKSESLKVAESDDLKQDA